MYSMMTMHTTDWGAVAWEDAESPNLALPVGSVSSGPVAKADPVRTKAAARERRILFMAEGLDGPNLRRALPRSGDGCAGHGWQSSAPARIETGLVQVNVPLGEGNLDTVLPEARIDGGPHPTGHRHAKPWILKPADHREVQ